MARDKGQEPGGGDLTCLLRGPYARSPGEFTGARDALARAALEKAREQLSAAEDALQSLGEGSSR